MALYVLENYWIAGYAEGETGQVALTGRRPRGRRIIYPDELDPLPVVLEAPEPLPSLEVAEAALIEAKAALETAIRTKAEKQQAKERAEAIATLRTALGHAQAQYNAAREREDAIIKRLRDEDELWLLAA